MGKLRTASRWGLIGLLLGGGFTMLVGPSRVLDMLSLARTKAQSVTDNILDNDDLSALRRKISKLADQYPAQIAKVRKEVMSVDRQISEVVSDAKITKIVVQLTTNDLLELKDMITAVQDNTKVRPASSIVFSGSRFDIDGAFVEARRISTLRQAYRDRMLSAEQQLAFLNQQRTRLSDILSGLETDYNEYRNKLWQIDNQITALQRNERLIELTEAQQATLESYERYGKIENFDQVEAKIAEIRVLQEAQLRSLAANGSLGNDYEARAESLLESSNNLNPDLEDQDDPFADIKELFQNLEPTKLNRTGLIPVTNN